MGLQRERKRQCKRVNNALTLWFPRNGVLGDSDQYTRVVIHSTTTRGRKGRNQSEITRSSNSQSEITRASNSQSEITRASNSQSEITRASNSQSEITRASNSQSEITRASNSQSEITRASNSQSEIKFKPEESRGDSGSGLKSPDSLRNKRSYSQKEQTSTSSEPESDGGNDPGGLDYPDRGQQGQGHQGHSQDQLESVHVTKTVEVRNEAGVTETEAAEITRSFDAAQESEEKDSEDQEDFFD